jgi:hypothetical protein
MNIAYGPVAATSASFLERLSRGFVATVLCALASALVMGVFGAPEAVGVAVVALLHALLFGWPLYFAVKALHRDNWVAALIGGVLIGALPIAIYIAVLVASRGVSDGVGSWLDVAEAVGLFAANGAVAGLTFWAVIRSWPTAGGDQASSHSAPPPRPRLD